MFLLYKNLTAKAEQSFTGTMMWWIFHIAIISGIITIVVNTFGR